MKSISIKQPFASLILLGLKKVEVRSWATKFRGRVLICSSKKKYGGEILATPNRLVPDWANLFPHGKAIGVVEIVNCRPMKKEDEAVAFVPYEPGLFVWELENPVEVEPFDVTGKLSFFTVPEDKVKPVRYDSEWAPHLQ